LSPRRSRAAGHRHLKSGVHELRLDCEVLELLRHDPELLAIADAVAATHLASTAEVPATAREEQDLGRSHPQFQSDGVACADDCVSAVPWYYCYPAAIVHYRIST
jgi:hypothetical protein